MKTGLSWVERFIVQEGLGCPGGVIEAAQGALLEISWSFSFSLEIR